MLKTLPIVAPLTVCALVTVIVLDANLAWTLPLLALSVAAVLPALAYAFRLTRVPHIGLTDAETRMMRLHVLAHAFPIAYILARLLADAPDAPGLGWIGLLAVFFYTGRRTWRTLHALRPAKMYFLFNRGNTGMLVMMIALSGAAQLFGLALAAAFVERVLDLYIAIHFMLAGIAVRKIDRDLVG